MFINLEEEIRQGLNLEQVNLASKLDEDEIKKIGKQVFDDFEEDLSSRSEWLLKHTEWKKLYNQQDAPEQEPWSGSSDDSIPIMTEACNSFQARAYKAFFPTRVFLDAIPIGYNISSDSSERADRIAKHMSFQLGVLNKNYKRDKNAMFLAAALNGSDFTKTFYDPVSRRNVVERVRAVDLVIPYNVGPIQIENVHRKTHVIFKTINESKILAKSGYFLKECSQYEIANENEFQEAENQFQGLLPNNTTSLPYCRILEQHCLLDLDGDGIKEPYIVWIDSTSQEVLRIQIRYDVNESGQPTNNKQPIEYFTHYKFLENPDGFYGLGIGHLIGKLNKSINRILRQSINAAELANTASGFIDEKVDIKGGEVEMEMGKFVKISGFGDSIRDSFFQLQFAGPNASYVNLMQGLEGYARSLASVTEAVTGDVDKVYQPVTITTMLEQSLQMPTSVMEQMSNSLQDELEKLFILNKKYLDQEAFFIQDNQLFPVSKEDYNFDYRVIPIFDPRNITKQQKIAKAQSLYQFAFQNPLMAQDQKSLYEVSKKMLEAMEIDDIKDLLPEPSEPPKPEKIDDQALENMYFLMPANDRPLFDVFPDQDHATHIKIIDELLSGPYAEEISKEVMQPILDHRKKHIAFLYIQTQQKLKEDEQRRLRAMAEESSNPENVAGFDQILQTAGEGYGLPGYIGSQEDSGQLGGVESLIPNRYGSETGFLDQVLPLPKEVLD